LARDARDEAINFQKFLEDATNTYRESRKRVRERPKVIAPGTGFAPPIKNAVASELDFIDGRDAIAIRWDNIAEDLFFEVDKDSSLIRLNRRYRSLFSGDGRGTLNDAPLVKALLYLLTEPALRGEILGSRDKDNLAIWQAVLTSAAKTELKAKLAASTDSQTAASEDAETSISAAEPATSANAEPGFSANSEDTASALDTPSDTPSAAGALPQ
jgi:hypothetical protein